MNENLELRKVIALEKIADSLEKVMEEKDLSHHERFNKELESIAEEISPFEPAAARLLMQYAK